MSRSKKKAKSSNEQKRSNKFMANKLRTNQSKSAFKQQEELELKKVDAQQQEQQDQQVAISVTPDEVIQPQVNTSEEVVEQPTTNNAKDETPQQNKQEAKDEPKNKDQKDKEKDKKDKQKKKEKAGKRKFGQRTKETFAELKRVTWPSFKETMKKTGLVIAVVLFFGVALFAIERLLSWLYTLLTSGILN